MAVTSSKWHKADTHRSWLVIGAPENSKEEARVSLHMAPARPSLDDATSYDMTIDEALLVMQLMAQVVEELEGNP